MRQPSLFSVARGDAGVHEGAHLFAKVSGSRRISKSKATVLEVGSEFAGKGCDGAAGEDGGQLADLRSVLRRGVSRRARAAMPSKITEMRKSAKAVWNGARRSSSGVRRLA